MSEISKFAVVHPNAKIGADVSIGPFCVIGPDVEIGPGCEIKNNVSIEGVTRIGPRNVFYQNCVIGAAPQDLKYKGGPTETIIGMGNVFRENCTVHRGTEIAAGKTVIGDYNLFMVGVHIAHDCILENQIVIANETLLAGHVKIESFAWLAAMIGVHHFVTIGKYSYIGAMTPVHRDVPPFMKFSGEPNAVRGINEAGLKRNKFTDDDLTEIKEAYRVLYRRGNNINASLDQLEVPDDLNPHVKYLCDFVRRSCEGRFGRFEENQRLDNDSDRIRRKPQETRDED